MQEILMKEISDHNKPCLKNKQETQNEKGRKKKLISSCTVANISCVSLNIPKL